MALTTTVVAREAGGNSKCVVVDFLADATYAAGGYALAQSDLNKLTGLPGSVIGDLVSFTSEANTGATSTVLDRTNGKLMFFLGSTECTTTISSKTVRARVHYGYFSAK
jgi:hypothetical protein